MSLLTYVELVELVRRGVIEGAHPDHINGASIDITLGDTVYVEGPPHGGYTVVDLAAKETPNMVATPFKDYFDLAPGQFCLASSREMFNLPNDIAAEFKLKSSGARAGLDAALALFCDPGWHGSVLTLELYNNLCYHHLRLRPGMKIGQMIFMRGTPVPAFADYAARGNYNGDKSATPSKGIR